MNQTMTQTTNARTVTFSSGASRHGYHLPVRCQWLGTTVVIAGTPGASGDAGWNTVECSGARHMERIAREYPQARMPAWIRLGL